LGDAAQTTAVVCASILKASLASRESAEFTAEKQEFFYEVSGSEFISPTGTY